MTLIVNTSVQHMLLLLSKLVDLMTACSNSGLGKRVLIASPLLLQYILHCMQPLASPKQQHTTAQAMAYVCICCIHHKLLISWSCPVASSCTLG